MGPSISFWNATTSALQQEELTSKGTRVSCVYNQLKCPYKKCLETYRLYLVYIIDLRASPENNRGNNSSFPCDVSVREIVTVAVTTGL